MSSHKIALVPIETSAFTSPDLANRKQSVDTGLLSEALVYYEQLLVNVSNEPQFAALIQWFDERGKFSDLVALIEEGTITFFHYAFFPAPVLHDGSYNLVNIQDEEQAKGNTFRRAFAHKSFRDAIPDPRKREQLERAIDGRVIEVRSEAFSTAIETTREDFANQALHTRALQAVMEPLFSLAKKPTQSMAVELVPLPGGQTRANWDFDLQPLSNALPRLGVHPGTLLSALLVANRHVVAASQQECDLYSAAPISQLIGDKFAQADAHRSAKIQDVIQSLECSVEFPDIRQLINRGQIGFRDVLTIRRKAGKLRAWLQQEGDRDRDALLAYHHDVAVESSFRRGARKVLRMFGYGLGTAVGLAYPTSLPIAAAGVAGTALLDQLVGHLEQRWRPVNFGHWASDFVRRSSQERQGG